MIEKIKKELCKNFEIELFEAILENLKHVENPLRLNNFAYSIRELTRHVLHRLAPNENVLNCSWYKNETQKENGISRNQRTKYAVQGGIEDIYIEETLGLDVKDIHKNLIKGINKLSKFTHIESDCFRRSQDETDRFVQEIMVSFHEFLDLINNCRRKIIDTLWEHIDSAVVEEGLRETILAIDSFTIHHSIEEIYTDKIVIYSIDHEYIKFRAHGSINCELQWGSNSDLRRGYGAVLSESFQFTCDLMSPVDEPDSVEGVEGTFGVDTNEFEAARYGLDEML